MNPWCAGQNPVVAFGDSNLCMTYLGPLCRRTGWMSHLRLGLTRESRGIFALCVDSLQVKGLRLSASIGAMEPESWNLGDSDGKESKPPLRGFLGGIRRETLQWSEVPGSAEPSATAPSEKLRVTVEPTARKPETRMMEAWQCAVGATLSVLGIAEAARWRVTSRIDKLRQDLTDRSDAMDTKAEARTDRLRNELTGQVRDAEGRISGRMDRMEDRLVTAIRAAAAPKP